MRRGLTNMRPTALTSHVMKFFEKVVLQHLRDQVAPFLDPLQFAYRKSVGVDNTLLVLLHHTYCHLETLSVLIDICSLIFLVLLIQSSHMF